MKAGAYPPGQQAKREMTSKQNLEKFCPTRELRLWEFIVIEKDMEI